MTAVIEYMAAEVLELAGNVSTPPLRDVSLTYPSHIHSVLP